jgi:mutator protein MutT
MMIRAGIALVGRAGYYLIRRRPELPDSPMPGYWEFPGGKCEPGESPAAACARECREETGLDVNVAALRRVVTHHYPHGEVRLHYYDCELVNAFDEPVPASGFHWVAAADLPGLRFPDANEPIVDELARAWGG